MILAKSYNEKIWIYIFSIYIDDDDCFENLMLLLY